MGDLALDFEVDVHAGLIKRFLVLLLVSGTGVGDRRHYFDTSRELIFLDAVSLRRRCRCFFRCDLSLESSALSVVRDGIFMIRVYEFLGPPQVYATLFIYYFFFVEFMEKNF